MPQRLPEDVELPDHLRPGLEVVFVGINPSEWAARAGHYYANPRNSFWDCLHKSGLTKVKLQPSEDARVLEFGLGLTDRVKRWTKSQAVLRADDSTNGPENLRRRLEGRWPRILAFNGKFDLKRYLGYRPEYGRQEERFGESRVFVLPSTSPANTLTPQQKLEYFQDLARWVKHNVQ